MVQMSGWALRHPCLPRPVISVAEKAETREDREETRDRGHQDWNQPEKCRIREIDAVLAQGHFASKNMLRRWGLKALEPDSPTARLAMDLNHLRST